MPRVKTPLHHAASNSSSDSRAILDILLSNATIPMISTKDNQGLTVLHTAIKSNNQSALNSIINKMKAMTPNTNTEQSMNIVDSLILEKNHNNENCLELSIKMNLPSTYILLQKSIINKESLRSHLHISNKALSLNHLIKFEYTTPLIKYIYLNKESLDLIDLFNETKPQTIKSIIEDLLKSDYKPLQYYFLNYIHKNDTNKITRF